ncbi:MAG: Unknown protein [uncultured Sulfurovum sp.]|uniref:Uncharacterized protein n=1 Tax=uncultured Sulfurovum sp. TaxID=269237 RepID=A0A6S6TMW2_9BACT|nr:MAG: Unknown protein [uncultured Sulfurovum sp.]
MNNKMDDNKEYLEDNYKLNKLFSYLVVYYWLLLYIERPSYIMLTLPIGLFVLYMVLIYIKNFSVSNSVSFMLLFVFFSVYLSFSRSDFTSLIAVTLFGLSVFFIDHFRLKISLKLLNGIFLSSIIIAVPLYYGGYNSYGFIPGQGGFSHNDFLSGRVSLFSNVTVSIYLSFIVLIINYFYNENRYQKVLFFILTVYFIYFGISRTVMMVLLFIFLFTLLFRMYPLKKNLFYQLIVPSVLIFLPITLVFFIEDIISYLIGLNNEFISEYFLRGLVSVEEVLRDIARTNIWKEHLRLFMEYPWGLSSEEILMHVNPDLHLSDGGGSESFLTRILMRYGFGSFFLYLFLFSLLSRATSSQNNYLYIFVYVFIFIGLTYGSFFVAYNALFLIFMASINYQKNHEKNHEKNF